jgi:hypothetical protein
VCGSDRAERAGFAPFRPIGRPSVAAVPPAGEGYGRAVPTVTLCDAEQHHEAVVALVADFRSHAAAVVEAARAAGVLAAYDAGDDHDDEVTAQGRAWGVWLHDPHGQFTAADGTVVEAHLYRPELLDAGFLLDFARTSGRHPAVLTRCADDPYATMCALLDAIVPGWDAQG